MIKAQSIIGKPVLSRADGERLDSVKDIIIGKDHTHVIALLISEGGLFSKPTVVPIQSVVSFGKDAVVITESQAATRADHVPEVAAALDMDEKLGGKSVYSETGDQHGKLADIYFDDKTGQITGVDVTDLGPGAASKSVAFLDMGDVISFGADAVVISGAAISKLQSSSRPALVDQSTSPGKPASADLAGEREPPVSAVSTYEAGRVSADETAAPAPELDAMAADMSNQVSRDVSGGDNATDKLPGESGDEGAGPAGG
jgi:uncharacterized protein YrrD